MAAIGLVLTALHFPWYVQIGIFGVLGFGFYLLHGCIQVHVTELSQTARGSATSLHSCFFYLGQAVGPVIYGFGFAHGGPEPSLLVGAVVVMMVGLVCSRLLRHRTASHLAPMGLVEWPENPHHGQIRPGVPQPRLRSNPSNLSGSFQRREPLVVGSLIVYR